MDIEQYTMHETMLDNKRESILLNQMVTQIGNQCRATIQVWINFFYL